MHIVLTMKTCLIAVTIFFLGTLSPALSAPGDVSLYAGGDVGDGAPATQAALNFPVGIQVGPDGRLYIHDKGHGRVRVVDESGMISTVAGGLTPKGQPAYERSLLKNASDISVDSSGNVYIAHVLSKQVWRLPADSSGVVTSVLGYNTGQTPLDRPDRIWLDESGNVKLVKAWKPIVSREEK